jgi:hypothetical protein
MQMCIAFCSEYRLDRSLWQEYSLALARIHPSGGLYKQCKTVSGLRFSCQSMCSADTFQLDVPDLLEEAPYVPEVNGDMCT